MGLETKFVESSAVILYRCGYFIVFMTDPDSNPAGIGVFAAIGQRLLYGAVYAKPKRLGQTVEFALDGQGNGYAASAGKFFRLPAQSRLQSQIIQHGRPYQQGEVSHRAQGFFR